jgi:hypothetical protein
VQISKLGVQSGKQEKTFEYTVGGFETLSSGFYFVNISSGDKIYTKKAVKN